MARNGYQYGTSPRKLEPDYNPQRTRKKLEVRETKKRDKVKVSKKERKKQVSQIFSVLAIFAVLVTISYRNSLINEEFNEVQDLKAKLAAIKKENEQLEVSIENSLNLNNVEQAAKEKLGMQKLTNRQTIYVELPKKDYVKSATEEKEETEEESVITKIINKILNK